MSNENMNIGIIGHCDPRLHTCTENHAPRGLLIVDIVKEQHQSIEKEIIKIDKYIEPFFDRRKKKPKNQEWQNRMKQLMRR